MKGVSVTVGLLHDIIATPKLILLTAFQAHSQQMEIYCN